MVDAMNEDWNSSRTHSDEYGILANYECRRVFFQEPRYGEIYYRTPIMAGLFFVSDSVVPMRTLEHPPPFPLDD